MRWRPAPKVIIKKVTERDWRSVEYDAITKAIRTEVEAHQPRQNSVDIGDDRFGQEWWCTVCHTRWPCRFIRWAHEISGNKNALLPLRSAIKGERIEPNGHGITLTNGTWMRVDGIEVPRVCALTESPDGLADSNQDED